MGKRLTICVPLLVSFRYMKNCYSCLLILLGSSLVMQAHAQKAYDILSYSANIYGSQIRLELCDGYLLASKITINSRYGDQVFVANDNEPNKKGDLRFDRIKSTGRYKAIKGSWVTLNGLYLTDHSSKINAIYWDGKIQKRIVFKR